MASRDDVYRRIPSGAAIHHQQQQHQQQQQQHHQQQQHASKMAADGAKSPEPRQQQQQQQPGKHYYPAPDPRRRARPSESKIPQKAYGRDPSPDKASSAAHRAALHKGYQSQSQVFGYVAFPKTNPMATPGDGKRYQPTSYELPERAPAKRDPREENRPRTCPPERTGPVAPELFAPPPDRVPPAGRSGAPSRPGLPERIGPPERLGPPDRPAPADRPAPDRIPPPERIGPPERIPPPERLGPPERHHPQERPSHHAAERAPPPAEPRPPPAGAGFRPAASEQPAAAAAALPPGYPTSLGPRLSDDELLRASSRDLLARYRHAEAEIARLMMDHGHTARELNRQAQAQAAEYRALQDAHRRLQDESQELRDLCCFLDDDRQKGRKLAREWQRFGRYTASVMRQEVAAYQSKLRQLDSKQQELVKDNLELKELCLYLDEERQGHSSLCSNCGAALNQPRDDGDGSSSSTAADEPVHAPPQMYLSAPPPAPEPERPRRSESRERLLEESIQRQRNLLNEHILQYIRGLERRLEVAEEGGGSTDGHPPTAGALSRPDAVVQAMRVLEVQEHLEWGAPSAAAAGLERAGGHAPPLHHAPPPQQQLQLQPPAAAGSAQLEDSEKALLRQMCNVVWRKLEDAPTS